MVETGERIYDDTRKKRIKSVWGEATYHEVMRGLNQHIVRRFKIPTKVTRTIMERTLSAYLAGEIEPFSGREVGHRCMQRRKHRYMYRTDHPGVNGRKCWRSAEVALERKFISSVFYHGRDEECQEADWETGEPIKPWVTISACDGSAVRVLALLNGDSRPSSDTEGEVDLDDEEEEMSFL